MSSVSRSAAEKMALGLQAVERFGRFSQGLMNLEADLLAAQRREWSDTNRSGMHIYVRGSG